METIDNVPEIQVECEKGNVSSENGTDTDDHHENIAQKSKLQPRKLHRRDSGSSVGEDEELTELTDEQREKIVSQAEYYFSDENLKRDGFLLKHVKRNKEGYVNLKLLASFKKMRSLSRDYRVIGEALKNSQKLFVNETGLKVRRVEPLSKELSEQVRVNHLVVSKIPFENPSMSNITDAFHNHREDVISVRIVKPGKKFPNDLQCHFSRHPALKDEVVAIVEFENADIASEAMKTNFHDTHKGLNVVLLELGPKQSKKKENTDSFASDTPVDSDGDIGIKLKKKKKNRLLEVSAKDDSSYASSSDGEFSSFSSCGKRYSRSHGNSPVNSPKFNRRVLDKNNNSKNSSKNNTPMSSPGGSPSFIRKTKQTPDVSSLKNGHKLSPLINNSNDTPCSSPEARRTNIQVSSENNAGQSAWMLKRMQLSADKENVKTESVKIGYKHLDIVWRQPKGPDGSNGFSSHPFKKTGESIASLNAFRRYSLNLG